MGRRVDVADLIDAAEAATLLGLGSRNAVSVYRKRYEGFPQPAIEHGTCLLWVRADVVQWSKGARR